jgi:hypothetical protein
VSGGWWWPGFLIQLAVFLTLVMGMTWALTRWTFRHMDEHIDARIRDHEHRPAPPLWSPATTTTSRPTAEPDDSVGDVET